MAKTDRTTFSNKGCVVLPSTIKSLSFSVFTILRRCHHPCTNCHTILGFKLRAEKTNDDYSGIGNEGNTIQWLDMTDVVLSHAVRIRKDVRLLVGENRPEGRHGRHVANPVLSSCYCLCRAESKKGSGGWGKSETMRRGRDHCRLPMWSHGTPSACVKLHGFDSRFEPNVFKTQVFKLKLKYHSPPRFVDSFQTDKEGKDIISIAFIHFV